MTPTLDHRALVAYAKMILARLERMSADCSWTHRASGLRGSLWNMLQMDEAEQDEAFDQRLFERVLLAFEMLKNAAREIPDPNELLFRGE
ncbi:MAG: hypothetical protein JW750_10950 [Anaerolineaceae bacterium]|nr:hypothetical protein [Anaerolineaceae bacterium]